MTPRIVWVKWLAAAATLGLLALSGCLGSAARHPAPGSAASQRLVMTWVAPYAVAVSKGRLNWWKELFPLVDGINSMGYEEIGAGAGVGDEAWRSFAAQEDASGSNVEKLMLGMPANKDEWRGKPALEHLRWLRDRGHAGMSLWDSQLDAAAWRTHDAWTTVREIRGGTAP
jgi:hypothetical protein